MQLTKAEEKLMELIWKQEKVFLKDIIDAYPDPKPAGTTIATLLKRMQDKGFVAYTTFGNSRQYYPLVKKSAYFSKGSTASSKTTLTIRLCSLHRSSRPQPTLHLPSWRTLKALLI